MSWNPNPGDFFFVSWSHHVILHYTVLSYSSSQRRIRPERAVPTLKLISPPSAWSPQVSYSTRPIKSASHGYLLYFPKICSHASLLYMALVSIPSHKFVRSPCWFFLLQEIQRCDFRVRPQWHNAHTKFHPNTSSGGLCCDRWIDRHIGNPVCVHFTHIAKRTYHNI
jgi:hypothetical protein